ncbi:aminoacyl-histidine dipeptidase [Muriicola sp. Z0-33]|uniref:aminoacyl-histidine dipeptidase n=1 Tax=Muriicola sp. Z0-33 TaxID=2816957 RepID=UPI002237C35D|nr:aminoacyl-histidine dipeptidase [Muriicola sp. Z0-33]MCW5515835.1 aminoacyl-histidine dipeptidase [Muriicola sp. Z0-33]
MNQEVRQLEPSAVWNKFADLNAVPRPSKKEERVIDFMMNFGTSLGLETIKDEVGNVIIKKPGTTDMANRETIILQSHLDMVHQKNADTQFDFDTEGIKMYVDGDWVKARGTTLGADNGLGVAAIMALLESEDISHPPLEALFTIDEETGMTGAMGLQGGILEGKYLLNLDTEEDNEIAIGCAGGIDVTALGTYKKVALSKGYAAFSLLVNGLQGGHSGMDIHKGLGNANKIMNRLLYSAVFTFNAEVAEIDGGGLRNAIPRESMAKIMIGDAEIERYKAALQKQIHTIKSELEHTEPDLNIELRDAARPEEVIENNDVRRLLQSIYAAQNGVYAMSAAIPDLVETSNNVARVAVSNGEIKIGCLTRSSVDSAKMDMAHSLRSAFELAGYKVSFSGDYPGWEPKPDSEILKIVQTNYESLFSEKPDVMACHAGLECGILGQNYPETEMVSFGPTIRGAHSPDERVNISSVQKFWKFLNAVLANTP